MIDLLQDNVRGREDRAYLSDNDLAISIITVGEIYEGIWGATEPAKHQAGFQAFLKGVEVIGLSRGAMRLFGRVRIGLRRTGRLIGDFDTLIAVTALSSERTLLTRNKKHFERIEGLKLVGDHG